MRQALVLTSLAVLTLLAGCVERKYVITSDPPNALAYVNGQPLGATPVDGSFLYHGDYDITLVKDGYETTKVRQPMPAKWYEWPGFDFVSEHLVPWQIKDHRRLPTYTLQPQQVADVNQLLERGAHLQTQGRALGQPGQPRQGARVIGVAPGPAQIPVQGSPYPPAGSYPGGSSPTFVPAPSLPAPGNSLLTPPPLPNPSTDALPSLPSGGSPSLVAPPAFPSRPAPVRLDMPIP